MNKIRYLLSFIFLIFPLIFYAQSSVEKYSCKKEKPELWRLLSEEGKYKDAIKVILDSLNANKTRNKSADYWHIGQLYAFDNDYKTAIVYIKKSSGFFNRLFDREWRFYYKGTIAFLKRDKKKLKTYNTKLWEKHSEYYHKNACTLNNLYENFEKPYKEASVITCK
jgi:hypothetical protein